MLVLSMLNCISRLLSFLYVFLLFGPGLYSLPRYDSNEEGFLHVPQCTVTLKLQYVSYIIVIHQLYGSPDVDSISQYPLKVFFSLPILPNVQHRLHVCFLAPLYEAHG